MRHLLALANPDQPPLPDSAAPPTNDAGYKERASPRSEWKGTVHALNVLKVVFVDATLADDVGPYVTQAGRLPDSVSQLNKAFVTVRI